MYYTIFNISKILILFIFIMNIMFGCSVKHPGPVCEKDGKSFGTVNGAFRSRWWNFYERGLSYLEGECYSHALHDLKEAVDQNIYDKRMARTYGMHFIDYFPHREIGIIHLLMGNLNDAKEELEKSIEYMPSDKARFYLDKVRQKLIQSSSLESHAPKIFIEPLILSKDDPVILSGRVQDNHFIAKLRVNNETVFLKETQKDVNFTHSMFLENGSYSIPIQVENLLGGIAKQTIVVIVDRQGPLISIETKKNSCDQTNCQVILHIIDETHISSIAVNDKPYAFEKGKAISLPLSIQLLNADNEKLKIIASDELGNTTKATIPTNQIRKISSLYSLLASSDSIGKEIIPSQNPPSIFLNDWQTHQVVYLDRIYLEGFIQGENPIESLTINNNPVHFHKGHFVFFNYPMTLKEGDTTITIRTEDSIGNWQEKQISITRRIPSVLQLKNRLRMALYPIEESNDDSNTLNKSFFNYFVKTLLTQNRFRLLERDMLKPLLDELYMQSFTIHPSAIVPEMEAAHVSLRGWFISTRQGIEIVVRIIDNETTQILAIEDVFSEQKDNQALEDLSKRLALKINHNFPIVSGQIIRSNGDTLFLNIGKDDIKSNRRFIIYKNQGNGTTVDQNIIGYAHVNHVKDHESEAQTIRKECDSLGNHEKVIAQ